MQITTNVPKSEKEICQTDVKGEHRKPKKKYNARMKKKINEKGLYKRLTKCGKQPHGTTTIRRRWERTLKLRGDRHRCMGLSKCHFITCKQIVYAHTLEYV
uniref:Uncharacterized protein n=1 Tax=Ceratitis capitata TaxID=7213 RepID=W8BV49_CERCA